MNTTAPDLFPHLRPDATWSEQQAAGDRMRAIYTKDAANAQAKLIGEENVHLGNVKVMWDNRRKRSYTIGLDFAFTTGRAMMVFRQMARTDRPERRHAITNAIRLRRALCFYGLSLKD